MMRRIALNHTQTSISWFKVYTKNFYNIRRKFGHDRRKWILPSGSDTGIKVTNSLCSKEETKLVPFIVKDFQRVTWYTCGPTVYDHAHIGHARCYVQVDILHRVLERIFGLGIEHVMGLTDVDDKIIQRANEQGIPFHQLAQTFEREFFADMKELGVRVPLAITRVSEHIDSIIQYIQKIIAHGFAYIADGSVYFDMQKFSQHGSLVSPMTENPETKEEFNKRDPRDFALWKAAKVNEPFWDSPWGRGRPGWHIECSAMICSMFGDSLDVHAGGIDLKFPHHENEINQCIAYFDLKTNQQWANYFLHTGHLHIHGLKMSKSLKNFVTIKEMLQEYSANRFRIFCLMNHYTSPVEYTKERMNDVLHIEKKFQEFFLEVSTRVKTSQHVTKRWSSEEFQLHNSLKDKKASIRAALADDFNTQQAMNELLQLVNITNAYMTARKADLIPTELLSTISSYVAEMLSIFGLQTEQVQDRPIEPLVDVIAQFRRDVRTLALEAGKNPDATVKSLKIQLLQLCDDLRDNRLPKLSIRLEDRSDGQSVGKVMDNLLEIQRTQEAQEREWEEKAKIPPRELFTSRTDLYSEFDENGVPTKNARGEPLPNSILRKLKKEWTKQQELHAKYKERKEKRSGS